MWEILREAGIDPAPDRAATTWTAFLRSQADALLAADFIEAVTLTGARMYALAVIEHAGRRVRILGATTHPTAAWVTQAARNLVMDLQDAGSNIRYLVRDRDGKYPSLFDTILADANPRLDRTGRFADDRLYATISQLQIPHASRPSQPGRRAAHPTGTARRNASTSMLTATAVTLATAGRLSSRGSPPRAVESQPTQRPVARWRGCRTDGDERVGAARDLVAPTTAIASVALRLRLPRLVDHIGQSNQGRPGSMRRPR